MFDKVFFFIPGINSSCCHCKLDVNDVTYVINPHIESHIDFR